MEILAHRGLWYEPEEQNTLNALIRALNAGFGIETDIRDHNGRIVISHDLPNDMCLPLDVLLYHYSNQNNTTPLALNIKADGLQNELQRLLDQYQIQNYFVFDTTIPDQLQYAIRNLKHFTRLSDLEIHPIGHMCANGLWIDQFVYDWVDLPLIRPYADKQLAFVSPELHGRFHEHFWKRLKEWYTTGPLTSDQVLLCTDYPDEALEYFKKLRR